MDLSKVPIGTRLLFKWRGETLYEIVDPYTQKIIKTTCSDLHPSLKTTPSWGLVSDISNIILPGQEAPDEIQ